MALEFLKKRNGRGEGGGEGKEGISPERSGSPEALLLLATVPSTAGRATGAAGWYKARLARGRKETRTSAPAWGL